MSFQYRVTELISHMKNMSTGDYVNESCNIMADMLEEIGRLKSALKKYEEGVEVEGIVQCDKNGCMAITGKTMEDDDRLSNFEGQPVTVNVRPIRAEEEG